MIGSRQSYRVAVIEWNPGDGITRMIRHELEALGHEVTTFGKEDPVPAGQDVVFTFGPYGKVIPLWEKSRRVKGNPATIHWNTEGIPDLRIPAVLVRQLAALRSLVGRVADSENRLFRLTLGSPRLPKLDHRMARFRYVGDYYYAYRKGLLDLLADSSMIYADIHRKAGIPVLYLPWGGSLVSSKDLGMERDIDVLWMGKRGSGRRSRLLDRVRAELKALGVEIYVADGEENPFIFGETRTEYLNRAKVTLNLTRTWYDDNFSRFSMAAPNRSLIVSEPVLPHCVEFQPGVHYVSAPIEKLAETILYYLKHEDERRTIVENAYRLVTHELAFKHSIKRAMDEFERMRNARVSSQVKESGLAEPKRALTSTPTQFSEPRIR